MAMTTDNVNKSGVKELESLEDAEISRRQENVSGKLNNQSSLIASRVQGRHLGIDRSKVHNYKCQLVWVTLITAEEEKSWRGHIMAAHSEN